VCARRSGSSSCHRERTDPLIQKRAGGASDLLSRSLTASWFVAAALAALFLPARPAVAMSILAGQLLASLNFFFLRKLVKLFTDAAVAGGADGKRRALSPWFFGYAALKMTLVYGGAFAAVRSGAVAPLPFLAGLSMPLLAMFLKSLMLALGSGPSSFLRRATKTAATFGDAAKPAALLLMISLVALPALARANEAPAAKHAEGGEQHLPNWVVILNDYFPGNPVVHWMHENEYLVFAWLAGLVFLAFAWIAMRRATPVPGQLQNALEWMIESMEDVCGGMLGKHLDRYFPYIIAIFFYILTMNLIGIIPGFKSSTASLDVTLALALMTFLYVQFWGIRNLGILGYLDHMAGSPRDLVGFIMLPVMIPVHILGELAKPISLSCRLFGNIFGEDTLIVVFVGATALCLKASLVALAVPPMLGISALFMLLQTLTSIVQALIFALLTTVYLYMMLPHEEHAHGEAGQH
jgi:F-type H+-transporting ATPase subunit a